MKIISATLLISLGSIAFCRTSHSQERNPNVFHLETPSVTVSFVGYTNSSSGRSAVLEITNQSAYLFLIKSNWNEILTPGGWIQTNQNARESAVLSHSMATIAVSAPDGNSSWRSALLFRAECGSGMSPERLASIKRLKEQGQKTAAGELYFPTWVFKTAVISNSISK